MANPSNASGFLTPEPQPPLPVAATAAAAAPARPVLVFRRTERGDMAVRTAADGLPLHLARLLMLFEGPLSLDDLRQMISDPWLPDGIIDLQRRKLIVRVLAAEPDGLAGLRAIAQESDPALVRRREQVRQLFLQQLGDLGDEMGRRIGRCASDSELEELMPQVQALVEAVAGRMALAEFHGRLAPGRSLDR